MKIIYVSNEYPNVTANYGGIAVVFKNEVEGLLDLGYEVEVILITRSKIELNTIPPYLKLFYWPSLKFLSGIALRAKLFLFINLNYSRKDIVICADYAGLLPFIIRSKKIVQLHESLSLKAIEQNSKIDILTFLLEYFTILFSSKLRAVSESVLINTFKYYPLTRFIYSEVIFNGLKNERLLCTKTHDYENYNVIFIGKLSNLKGVDFLGGIINRVHHQLPLVTFTIIGHDEISHLASNKLKLENEIIFKKNIEFIPRIENEKVKEYLEKSSILILPSRTEALPMVVLEAFLNSVPVVAFEVGGIPEMIDNGFNGFIIPKYDVEMFAVKIIDILSNKELHTRMSVNARIKFNSHFRLEDTLINLKSFYNL
jgi:glycosyltransferase involved in cell wall biosynthesis